MLKLTNSMSREKEEFRPRGLNGQVKIFTCGPSTYQRPHIGNYRTFLYEDVLVRYLEYLGYTVERLLNFTDVEDKAVQEAVKRNQHIEKITTDVAEHFFREAEQLKIKLPPTIARSSTSVHQAARLIKDLIKSGHAYPHRGDIFFDPLKFKDFGKLFRLDMSRWPKNKVRFRKDTYIGRRWNLGDFILWHGHEEGDPVVWDTEIGSGRPSWNIQDPAMITEHLGYQVDINCGGIDNIYRHHDYNIAIMESLSGKDYARYYLHGEHLVVNGKKMSKSVGNILFPDDIWKKGFKPQHLRFFLIHTHYRKKLNYTEANLGKSRRVIDDGRKIAAEAISKTGRKTETPRSNPRAGSLIDSISSAFETHMNDDLAVGRAFDAVVSQLNEFIRLRKQEAVPNVQIDRLQTLLKKIDAVWGFLL